VLGLAAAGGLRPPRLNEVSEGVMQRNVASIVGREWSNRKPFLFM
jgi:hypothetical protein